MENAGEDSVCAEAGPSYRREGGIFQVKRYQRELGGCFVGGLGRLIDPCCFGQG